MFCPARLPLLSPHSYEFPFCSGSPFFSFLQPSTVSLPVSVPVQKSMYSTPTPTITPSPSLIPTMSPTNTPIPIPLNPLLSAVNEFRRDNNQSRLSLHSLLCTIARERVEVISDRGSLDNHEGYPAYKNILSKSFNQWWETLFYGSSPNKSHDIVYTYWANSSGHRNSLLSSATHGCGAEKNGYAVFELGRK